MRKIFFSKLVNTAKQLLNNTNNITLSIMNSKGVKTALKNLFPLWNNGKKKVNKVKKKTKRKNDKPLLAYHTIVAKR